MCNKDATRHRKETKHLQKKYNLGIKITNVPQIQRYVRSYQ